VQATLLPSTQGRDGSPQPSQVSGADAPSWPFKLQVSGLNSPVPPLRASAPPREIFPFRSPVSGFRSRLAFTLLEVLVATAVLALMMTFLFNLLGSSAKIWEIGNKKIEAAQAARVGLNIMAKDLKNAFAGNMTSYTSNGTSYQNYANFFATTSPPNTIGLGNATTSNGSHQIRFIASTPDPSDPLNEIGYQCVYMTGSNPIGMTKNRSFLVRKRVTSSSAPIFFRTNGPAPTTPDWNPINGGWNQNSGNWQSFQPIIENCISFTLNYAYWSGTAVEWTDDPNSEPTPDNYSKLPLGVLVTITVIDSRTAEKLAQVGNNNSADLIAQGSVTMSRFIPFNSQ
jgi:prepilin-type N-terminal cleavage/methylation domain-containing protein